MNQPFYDPAKTWDENFKNGPFGDFSNRKIYEEKGEPRYDFLGFKLYSPFGIPAGPVINSNFVKAAFEKGFDVVTYKTQRSIPFKVNEFPNILYVEVEGDLTSDKAEKGVIGKKTTAKKISEISITNSFGNPSKGPEFWMDDLKKALSYQKKGQLLVMSVVGTIKEGFSEGNYYNDFAYTAKLASQTGVRAIEVNLSCPNVANEGILCYTPSAVFAIIKKTKEAIGDIPLVSKIGYFTDKQQELLEDIVKKMEPFVNAISSINTIPAAVYDVNGKQALPGHNRLKSGICGAGVKWAGIDMVKRLKQIRKKLHSKFEIIGVGGVMNVSDFLDYRNAGADVVESATGAMWNPNLSQEIKRNLR